MNSTPTTAPDFALLAKDIRAFLNSTDAGLHMAGPWRHLFTSASEALDYAAKQHPAAPAPLDDDELLRQATIVCEAWANSDFSIGSLVAKLLPIIRANLPAPQVDEGLVDQVDKLLSTWYRGDREKRALDYDSACALRAQIAAFVSQSRAPHAAATVLPEDVAGLIKCLSDGEVWWLVESEGKYWRGEHSLEFVADVNQATRFATEMAAKIATGAEHNPSWKIVDHLWFDADTIKLIERLARQLAERQWRDIASAPKDGTEIILGMFHENFSDPLVINSCWIDREERGQYWLDWEGHPAPTHWMPLKIPARQPPSAAPREGEGK
jgi:hypothetical protein